MQSAKRAAEDFARVNHGSDVHPSKKPRFDVRNPSALAPDALEDDAVLDADVIGPRGPQVKRGAVNVDGYDSDSDNENFEIRAAAKAKASDATAKSKEEEQDDMFADLEDDFKDGDDSDGNAGQNAEGRKKTVKFLDEDQIEGQVQNSKSGGHVSADFTLNGKQKARDEDVESSSDSEVDDEQRASHGDVDEEIGAGGKKSHAPKLDAFNMREENEDGKFDDQGNYVRKAADPDAKHDVWLEGISKKEMKKAQEAHEKREQERRQKALDDDSKNEGDILKTLILLLQPAETVLEALARLNKGQKKKPKWRAKSKNKTAGDEEMSDSKDDERATTIESLTEAADLFFARGQADIYDTERELLIRQYQRASGEQWSEVRPVDDVQDDNAPTNDEKVTAWQYRWSDARDGGESHGPYDVATMKAWSDAGYFGEAVEYCKIGDAEWTQLPKFV